MFRPPRVEFEESLEREITSLTCTWTILPNHKYFITTPIYIPIINFNGLDTRIIADGSERISFNQIFTFNGLRGRIASIFIFKGIFIIFLL